jgi:hypothetical protein
VSEKLTGVNHPNGIDIWLIAHKHYSDTFYAYLITPNGISDTIITHIGSIYGPSEWQAQGQMKASPNGKKIGSLTSNNGVPNGAILDFNDSTGVVSNLINLTSISYGYSLEFSPDNSKLYVYGIGGIFQFDLSAGTEAAINASKTTVSSDGCVPCGMQLGPDGKIYTAMGAAILYPNLPAALCGYTAGYISTSAGTDFPSFISSFQYHNGQNNCLVVSVNGDFDKIKMSIYPNPFSKYLNVKFNENYQNIELSIFNLIGKKVFSHSILGSEEKIDLSFLQNGLFFLYITSGNKYWIEKIIKQ